MEEKIRELLEAAGKIASKYPSVEKKEDSMNLFRVLEIQRREVYLCRVLVKLLKHRSEFLKLFFDYVLRLPITIEECGDSRTWIEPEWEIENARRIDIFIHTGHYDIPIEAKIDYYDREAQLWDYAQKRKNAPVYYLTLNGRQPSDCSITQKGGGSRLEEKDYCCVSFSSHIILWIENCLELPGIENSAKTVLHQLKDILVENTSEEEQKLAMETAKIIRTQSRNGFMAAAAIEAGLKEVKIQMMEEFLGAVYLRLKKYGAKEPDKNCIKKYYQSGTNSWPGIVIPLLVGDGKYALRIEIQNNLYYGVCNYRENKAPFYNDHCCNERNDEARARSAFVRDNLSWKDKAERTDSFYWWHYLPEHQEKANDSHCLNFRSCEGMYLDLYDNFEKTVNDVCGKVEEFLIKVSCVPRA